MKFMFYFLSHFSLHHDMTGCQTLLHTHFISHWQVERDMKIIEQIDIEISGRDMSNTFQTCLACLPAHVICRVLMGEAKFKSEVLNQRLYLNIWHALSCLHHSTPGLSIAYKDGLWFPTMKEKITLLFCDEVIQGAFSLSLVVEIPTKDSMMAKPTRTINKSRSS